MKNVNASKLNTINCQDFSQINWQDNEFSSDSFASSFYNFNLKTKKIKGGLGISEATIPLANEMGAEMAHLNTSAHSLDSINKVLYFRQYFPASNNTQHRLLIHGADNKLYVHQMYSGTGNLLWLYQLTFDSAPICLTYKLNGNDTIILSSPEKMIVWTTNQTPYQVTDVPIITSMCISNNVLFCTIAGEADKIWFNTSLNPELIGTTSSYTQYLTLGDERGYARKILTFKENLYVFRDYGITRINYFYTTNIDVKQVYLSDSKIFADTVKVCGDVVMFLTRDGLYSFDGVNVKKQTLGLEHLLDKDNYFATAECLQDKYYLALKMDFKDNKKILCENQDFKNNVLLVVDLQDFSYEIMRGVDVKSMLPLKTEIVEKMLVTFNSGNVDKIGEIDSSSKYFETELPKFYETNKLFDENIVIRKIFVNTTAGVTIKFVTDDGEYEFTSYTDGVNEFETIIPCKQLKLKIETDTDNCEINQIKIKYYKK